MVVAAYALAQVASGAALLVLAGLPLTSAALHANLGAIESGRNVALSSAIGELVMPVVAWLFLHRNMKAQDIRLRGPHFVDVTGGIALLLFTILLSVIFGALLHTGDVQSQVGVAGRLHSLWWEVPVIAVAAGVAEEIVFRGYLLEGLRRIWPRSIWPAVAVSSVAFGLAHLTWGLSGLQFLFYIALGVLFAIFVLRRRSLWPAIFAHVAWDAIAFLLLYVRAGG
jgi:membrane protease YdiL (CAAX protease family)